MPQAPISQADAAGARPKTGQSQSVTAPAKRFASASSLRALAEELARFGTQSAEHTEAGPDCRSSGTPANDDTAPVRRMPEMRRRRLHIHPRAPIHLLQLIDWMVIAVAAEAAAHWGAGASLLQLNIAAAGAFIVAALGLKAGLWLTGAYAATPGAIRAETGLAGLTLGAFLALAGANLLAPTAREAGALSATLPAAAALLAGVHAALALWVRAGHRRGVFSERIVIVGATDAAERFMRRLRRSGEARVVALADDRILRAPHRLGGRPVGGGIDALLAWDGLAHVDRIVIAIPPKAEMRLRAVIARLRALPHRIDVLLDVDADVTGKRSTISLGAPLARVAGRDHDFYAALTKRAFDAVIAAALLVFLAPLMATIALAVKLSGEGPVLHRQRRYGLNNRIITLLKFRTMRELAHAPITPADPGDPRITRLGRWLRRSRLDALPLLFSVLNGDMSLVGPHPHLVGLKPAQSLGDYAHRHRVKPGLTGWAQIHGARGAGATPARLRKHVRLDLDYAARASLWLDAEIIARSLLMRRSR
jgi:lipopolysaccharide/colanic/teichoic acid biosynthesis glycosyltransferase